jgi:hypothetical protein
MPKPQRVLRGSCQSVGKRRKSAVGAAHILGCCSCHVLHVVKSRREKAVLVELLTHDWCAGQYTSVLRSTLQRTIF